MSKIDDLKKKYSTIIATTFKRFEEGDITNTKKYLPYMLKQWNALDYDSAKYNGYTIQKLIDITMKFDELLPYIENKDIYSSIYNSIQNLEEIVDEAELIKDNKSFNRTEHIIVIDETDDYIFLLPKTHKASKKYGTKTTWCTTGRNSESTFNMYKKFYIAYLIRKKEDCKSAKYNKIAVLFYTNNVNPITDSMIFYHAQDQTFLYPRFVEQWGEDLTNRLLMKYRIFIAELIKYEKIENEVNKQIKFLENFNIDRLFNNITKLNSNKMVNVNTKYNDILQDFITSIKNYQELMK